MTNGSMINQDLVMMDFEDKDWLTHYKELKKELWKKFNGKMLWINLETH